MVVLGCDSHKKTHTIVAADSNGCELGQVTVKATPEGHLEALRWAARWDERRWALEDCRHLSRRLEADLLRAGEPVVRVPPKLMAAERRGHRQRGKSDPIDALAVARAALREPNLPVAQLDGPEREVRLLADHREDLVAERTRAINRLRWTLHDLEAGWDPAPLSLTRYKTLDGLARRLATFSGVQAAIAAELVEEIRRLTRRVNELERQLAVIVTPLAPTLLTLEGVAVLTAAKIVGETAGIGRFSSRAAYARHNGSAPIPVWSSNRARHRLNRGGNRQLNAALHRIVITQIRHSGATRDYYDRLKAAGKTSKEALRILRRRASDEVYRRLRTDENTRHQHTNTLPTAA